MLRLRTQQWLQRFVIFCMVIFPYLILLKNQLELDIERDSAPLDSNQLYVYENDTEDIHVVPDVQLVPKQVGYTTKYVTKSMNKYATIQDIPSFKVKDISCQKLFQQDNETFTLADKLQNNIVR